MASAADEAWKALPHGPIEKLDARLWRVEAELPGMAMKRVMSVARMKDGGLVVHNGVAMDEASMAELDRFGEVRFVIVPNGYHRIDAARFAKRYPSAKILCPPGARRDVAKKVRVDGDYSLLPADPHVSLELLEGVKEREGVMTVRGEAGTSLVFNDAIFNMPHVSGVTGWMLKNVTKSSGGPRLTRVARMFLLADGPAFAGALRRFADTPELVRVVVSHHEVIAEQPADVLRAVADSV